MSEITVDVDDQVLTAAAQALRKSTEKDTVNAALRAAVEHGGISHAAPPPTADADEAFDRAWNRLAEIAESGVWDWMSDKRAYRGGYPLPDRLERPLADDAQ